MWPTIYVVEDIEANIERVVDMLTDLKWLKEDQYEPDYSRPWRNADNPLLKKTWPPEWMENVLRGMEWTGVSEENIRKLHISDPKSYETAKSILSNPDPGSYLLLDLRYEEGTEDAEQVHNKAENSVSSKLYAEIPSNVLPGMALGEIFMENSENTYCMVATQGNPHGLDKFYDDWRIINTKPATKDKARKTVFDLIKWILEKRKSENALKRLRNSAEKTEPKSEFEWIINSVKIFHNRRKIEKKHGKAIRNLLTGGLDVPYEIVEGELTLEAQLLHEGFKNASTSLSESTLTLSVVWAMAALAMGETGKKLNLKAREASSGSVRCLESTDAEEFQREGDLLNEQGENLKTATENRLDYAKKIYNFFSKVRENIDTDEQNKKSGLMSECFVVRESRDRGNYVGIEFTFGQWPLKGAGKRYALHESVMWHLVMKTVQGGFTDKHKTSKLLAECIWRGGWTFEADAVSDTCGLFFGPNGEPNTVLRFATTGLRFLVKT